MMASNDKQTQEIREQEEQIVNVLVHGAAELRVACLAHGDVFYTDRYQLLNALQLKIQMPIVIRSNFTGKRGQCCMTVGE